MKNKFVMNLGIVAIYFIGAKFGLLLAFVNPSSSAVWPPTGIAIATLLLGGYKLLPAIFIGAFLSNITTAGTPLTSLSIALGNTLEALTASYLVNTYARGKNAFDRPQEILKFTFFAAFLSPIISATMGTTTLLSGGLVAPGEYNTVWITWFLGNMGGALIFAPLILLWSKGSGVKWSPSKILESAVIFFLFFILAELTFGYSTLRHFFNYPFIFLPLFAWVAFRFGQLETAVLLLFLSVKTIIGTLLGFGPFVRSNPNDSLLLVQSFLNIMSLTALPLAAAAFGDRKRAENFKKSEERYRKVIETSPDAIMVSNPTGVLKLANSKTAVMYGYTSSDPIIGRSITELVDSIDQTRLKEALATIIKNGKIDNIIFTSNKKNGDKFITEATASVIFDSQDMPESIIIAARDVTERETSRKKTEELAAIVESSNDAIVGTTLSGMIKSWNRASEKLFGYSREEVVNSSILMFIPLDRKHEEIDMLNKIRSGEKIEHFETKRLRKDGKVIDVSLTISPIKDANDVVIGVSNLARDISDRKELEQMRGDFFWMATHQLRTPLSSLRWNIELLLNNHHDSLPPEVIEKVKKIQTSAEAMIEQIKEILAVTRMQVYGTTHKNDEINIRDIIDEILKEQSQKLKEKSLSVKVKGSLRGTVTTTFDKQGLKDIIQNLVSNAIKYNKEKGTILVDVMTNGLKLNISVNDSGIGIPQDDQKKIFSRFFRATNVKDAGGTGLGLSLTKMFLEDHNGSIWFESNENKGSTFHIELPIIDKISN